MSALPPWCHDRTVHGAHTGKSAKLRTSYYCPGVKESEMAERPDELQQCESCSGTLGLRCEGEMTAISIHNGDHWAHRRGDGLIVRWVNMTPGLLPDGAAYGTGDKVDSPDRAVADSRQVGGNHYSKFKIQPWDIVDEYGLSFYAGSALKYLLRAGHKGPTVEDLKKCRHYLDKMIELEEKQ